jgi:predicted nucleotidyltransferase
MANSKQREIASAHISEIARTIKEKFNPRRVILFGSYAYGVPATKGSGNDIDLFVIMNTSLPVKKQAFLIRREITSSIPLDVIVRTPEQVEERLKLGDFFIKKIMEKGVDL